MNNTKRNTGMSSTAFCFFAIVATCLFALGMNALMNHMDAKRIAEEQTLAELCRYKPDVVKRPFVCVSWDAHRNEGRATTPQG